LREKRKDLEAAREFKIGRVRGKLDWDDRQSMYRCILVYLRGKGLQNKSKIVD